MRVIGIVEKTGDGLLRRRLCYAGLNAGGKTSFNGIERKLFALSPGGLDSLPGNSAGLIISESELPDEFFLAVGEVLFRSCASSAALKELKVIRGGFVALSARASFLRPVKSAVLTVSDKGAAGEREDTSGPALAERLEGLGCDVEASALLPDNRQEIEGLLKDWSDNRGMHLILCTGGTGFSPRDVTPEAVETVAERLVPGIGEAMRAASLKITPRAVLSRANAAIRGGTLIISLPGSEKAARECFDSVSGALRHGIEIIRGWDGECASSPADKGGN
ncbi:MAG: MogA/MoaB family molybdenum cofactor biosynthesis protein [Aminivibrio sp.]|jgi:molybdopterin adenylyltransferase